jgi:hypothetical protein
VGRLSGAFEWGCGRRVFRQYIQLTEGFPSVDTACVLRVWPFVWPWHGRDAVAPREEEVPEDRGWQRQVLARPRSCQGEQEQEQEQGKEEGAGGRAVAFGCGHCAAGLADDEDEQAIPGAGGAGGPGEPGGYLAVAGAQVRLHPMLSAAHTPIGNTHRFQLGHAGADS